MQHTDDVRAGPVTVMKMAAASNASIGLAAFKSLACRRTNSSNGMEGGSRHAFLLFVQTMWKQTPRALNSVQR